MTERVRLDVDGAVAVITNDNPEKHNAFDDDMDAQLFGVLQELRGRKDVRAVVWRLRGQSLKRCGVQLAQSRVSGFEKVLDHREHRFQRARHLFLDVRA